jgi:prevent-host-death family protein
MAKQKYALTEAKAKLSEVMREVKRGRRVTITERGVPIAEVVPIEPKKKQTLAERLAELEALGVITPAAEPGRPVDALRPIASRPGALKRFLEDRSRY